MRLWGQDRRRVPGVISERGDNKVRAVSDAVVDGLNKSWVVLNHECCIMTSK